MRKGSPPTVHDHGRDDHGRFIVILWIVVTDRNLKAPRSRRERPAKPALTREGIIDAALTILAEEGLGKVTMRRIATALDTGHASLYVYVRDTEDLHAQILDALLGRMPAVSNRGDWRSRLHEVLASYTQILHAHPEIARMTVAAHPVGPNYFALVESILDLLSEGGVPDNVAAWGVDLLLSVVTANAVEHSADDFAGENDDALAATAALIATMGESYPRIVRLGDGMVSGTGTEHFHWGLDVLINGILNTPRP
jgi:AcrR family transcriptional regulator